MIIHCAGDVLVYVMDQCVLGYTHHDMVNMFQSIAPGQSVALEVCRGYPLPFDPNDPNTEIVTTVAVSQNDKPSRPASADLLMQTNQENQDLDHRFSKFHNQDRFFYFFIFLNYLFPCSLFAFSADDYDGVNGSGSSKIEFLTVQITKGAMGFGFTIADSAYGQKVKTILDRPRCKNLQVTNR